jgi:hypothetical protein
MSATREQVLGQMQAKYDAGGQRLFWASELAGDQGEVRRAVDALEAEGVVKWYLEFQCPECNAEWGGHPSKAPSVCEYCGYNWREEEDDGFFEATKFTWNVEPKPSAEDERDALKARVAALEARVVGLEDLIREAECVEQACSWCGADMTHPENTHERDCKAFTMAGQVRGADAATLARATGEAVVEAVTAEREACARAAEAWGDRWSSHDRVASAQTIAAAIRARGGR